MQKKKAVATKVPTKKKVVPKKKEETFLEGAKRIGSNIVTEAKNAFSPKGKGMYDSRTMGGEVLGLDLSGSDAGTYRAYRNPLSSQYGNSPAEQKRPVAAKGYKKAPVKMKKC